MRSCRWRCFAATTVFTFCSVLGLHAQSQNPGPKLSLRPPPELRDAMAELRKASLAGDTERVERPMADEYLQTNVSGQVQDKSAWLAEYFKPYAALIKAGTLHWETYKDEDVRIRVFGDAAVIIGRVTVKATGAKPGAQTWEASPGSSFSGSLRFTRVWIKRDGKWLLAALHNAFPPPSLPANK